MPTARSRAFIMRNAGCKKSWKSSVMRDASRGFGVQI